MASSSSKRQSVMPRAPAGPKAPVNFSSSLVIADSVVLLGHHTINISSESVVHPRAKLDSSNGRITVGRRCIIHERTLLGAPSEDKTPVDSRDGVVLSDYVTVDVGAIIEAGGTTIGESSTIGVGCRVGRGAKLGKVRLYTLLTQRRAELLTFRACCVLISRQAALHTRAAKYHIAWRMGPRLHCRLL